MIARWAKAFYEGNYKSRQAEIDRAIGEGRTVGGNFNNEAGASYVVSVLTLPLVSRLCLHRSTSESCRGMRIDR